ncbi:hypothetical protein FI667_g16248, partial [Globisporangium splendens]
MAPSSSGHAGAHGAGASSAKRSLAELKRDVLALVQDTFEASRASSDGSEACVDACYACFQSACRAWIETCALAPPRQHKSEENDAVVMMQQQQEELMRSRLRAVVDLMMRHHNARERRKLVTAVVRSIVATQTIAQRKRKRKLPSTSADSLTDTVATACTEDVQNSVAELIAVWSLHTLGLLRLEDVLIEAASSCQSSTFCVYDWMAAPAHFLLLRPAIVISLLGTPEMALAATTRDLVEHVLSYVIWLAFADSADPTFLGNDTNRRSQSDAIKRKAVMRVLESLTSFSSATFSIPALCILTQLIAAKSAVKILATDRPPRNAVSASRDGSGGNFGEDSIISRDRVIAFLQPQLAALLAPSSMAHSACTTDELARIFSAYQACLPTSAFVQIIRQFIYEANGESTERSAAGSKSIIRDALYQLIQHLASKQTEFVAQLLTVAHEMANEGVQGMNGNLLQHALELVAAVSEVPFSHEPSTAPTNVVVDCYRGWFHDHFAADDLSHDRSMFGQGGQGVDTQQAALRCQKPRQACKLVTSKRQIQFLCAFLLEFDRRADESNEPNDSVLQYPAAKSDHVAAHLSVVKTHQPQFPSGGLIMDFCSQTRSRYLELLEQEQTAAQPSTDSDSSNVGLGTSGAKSKQQLSLHSMKVRDMVRENIHIYEDTKKLSPQLRQWQMFQPQLWKQEFVPCCLDIEYDGLEDIDEATSGKDAVISNSQPETKVLAHASFVHALATTGVISLQEYAQFLSKVEDWVHTRQTRFHRKRSYKRQRQEIGKGLSHAVESLQHELRSDESEAALLPSRKKVPPAQMEMLTSALESALSSLAYSVAGFASQPNSAAPSVSPMRSLWGDGCMKVVGVLGLSQLDAFFAYLVPLLVRTSSSQDLESKELKGESQSEADVLEAFTQFCILQVSWTRSLQDETLLLETSCLCAVLAALLARSENASKNDRADSVRFLQQIDDTHLVEDGGSDAVQSDSRNERMIKRSLFYTSILRALAAVSMDTQASTVLALLHSETLQSGTRDFVSWLVFRSTIATNPSREVHLSLLADNFCAISQMRWYNQVLDPMKKIKDRVRSLFEFEFRYGLKLFGESDVRSQLASNVSGHTEWVQAQLDVVEDIVQNHAASVEDVMEWLIEAIVSECSIKSEEKGELLEADSAIAQMLLLLNDLMHKASAQSLTSDLGWKNSPSRSNERILAYFMSSVQKARESRDRRRYVSHQLRHHGFEVLEICARHQCRAISSQTANSALELINYIGENYFHDQILPWSLLRALFVYLTQVLASATSSSMQNAIDILRNCSVAIICRCGLEYRRIQALVQDPDNRTNVQFLSLLEWVHRFCDQVLDQEPAQFAQAPSDTIRAAHNAVDIFPTEVEIMKYRIRLIKLLFRWKRIPTPELTTQAHKLSASHHEIAERILRVCRLDSSTADTKNYTDARGSMQSIGEGALVLVGTCFAEEWERALLASTTQESNMEALHHSIHQLDFQFQLCCLHVVATVCQQSALFSKKLLSSWREPSSASSSSSSPIANGLAGTILLALVAIILLDVRQLETVCGLNSSIWVNEFPRIALHVHSMKTGALDTSGTGDDDSSLVRWIQVITHTRSFAEHLVDAVRVVLQYGFAHRVDIVDSALPSRVLQAWPSLSSMVPQLHAITFDESNEF